MLFDQMGVLVLSVVIKVSVEPVAPRWSDHVEEQAELVVDEGKDLGDYSEFDAPFLGASIGDHFFENQKVPLFVVLLGTAFGDPVKHAASQGRSLVSVRDGDIGDL